jgi:hypothetical protein
MNNIDRMTRLMMHRDHDHDVLNARTMGDCEASSDQLIHWLERHGRCGQVTQTERRAAIETDHEMALIENLHRAAEISRNRADSGKAAYVPVVDLPEARAYARGTGRGAFIPGLRHRDEYLAYEIEAARWSKRREELLTSSTDGRTWTSPQGVRHAIDHRGRCATCGRNHADEIMAEDVQVGDVIAGLGVVEDRTDTGTLSHRIHLYCSGGVRTIGHGFPVRIVAA